MDLITQVSQLAAAGASAGGEEAEATDDNFQDTVLLLHGDGTDGAGDTSALGDPNYKALRENSASREIIVTGNPYGTDFSPYYYSDGYWSNYFEGSGHLTFPSSTDFVPGVGEFCLEFWVFPEKDGWLVGNRNGGYNPLATYLDVTNSRIRVWMSNNGGSWNIINDHYATGLTPRQWNHFALVRDSSNSIKYYMNGSETTITSSSASFTSASNFYVGGSPGGSDVDMTGHISNVRFVKGSSVYTGAFTPSTTPFTDPTTSGELSVYFDNSGDYLQLTDTNFSDFNFGTGEFLIEGWVYYESQSLGAANTLLGQTGWGNTLQLTTGGILQFYQATSTGSSGTFWITGTSALPLNRWTHFAIQRDSSGNLDLWINGTREATTTSYSGTTMQFYSAKGDITLRYWNGTVSNNAEYISNFRIKNSAVYTSGASITVPTAPFTSDANTKLLTCQSKIFTDESTSDHPIIVNGNTKVSEFGPFGDGYWSNYFASGSNLDISNNADLLLGTGDYTIEGWFKSDITGSEKFVVMKGINATGGFLLGVSQDYINWRYNGTSTTTISQGTGTGWSHIAITRTGGYVKIFLNGSVISNTTNGGSVDYTNTSDLDIGSISGLSAQYRFVGYISNFRFVKGTALYTSAFTPSTSPFTTTSQSATASEVKLLTCQSNRFIDNSSTGHSITLSGSPTVEGIVIPFEYLKRQTKLITCQGNRFKDIIPERWVPTLVDHPMVSTNTPFTVTKANNVGSVYLSSTTDDLEIKVSDLPTGASARCMEFWVYLPEQSYRGDTEYLVQYGAQGTNQVFSAAIVNASGKPRLRFIGYSSDYTTDDDMNENAWNFVSVVYTGSAVHHYLNGRLVHQSTRTLNTGSHTALWVNAEIGGGDTYVTDKFYIADLAVYDIQKRSGNFLPPTTTVANTTNTKVLTAQYSGAVRNLGFLDDSNYNHVITRINDAHMGTFSPFSAEDGYWSNYFDGNHPMEVPDTNSALDLPGDFTVEFWAYETRIATSGGTTNLFFTVNYLDRFQFGNNGTNVFFYNGGLVFSTTPSPLNQWNHYALVREGSGTNNLSCYRNGTRLTQATNTYSYAADSMMIGGQDRGGTTGYHGLYGWISNFRIVKGTALYSGSSYTVPTEPLTAISGTTLLTCQSNRIIDNSTNDAGITTNITSATKVQPFSPFTPSRSYSKDAVGGSVYNDGSDGLKLADATRALGTSDLEIEFWYYPTTSSGNKYLIGADFGPILLYVPSGSTDVRLYSDNDGNTPWNIFAYKTLGNIRMSQWNHIYLSRVSSAFYAFINGTASSQNGDAWSTNYTLEKPLYVGTYSDSGLGAATGYTSNLKYNIGSGSTTKSVPTAPTTPDSNTYVHLNFSNAGIIDHTMKHNLETEGNTRIRTDIKKFSTGSIYFDGVNGSTLKIPYSPLLNFGTGDFTIEFFIYFTSTSGYKTVYSHGYSGAGSVVIQSNNNVTGLRFFIGGNQAFQSDNFSLNTWYHVAWIRSGTDSKLFIDGTQNQSTATNFGHDANSTSNAEIGQGTNGWSGSVIGGPYPFLGCIDEFRITNGVARYTSDFTPPTQSFANR